MNAEPLRFIVVARDHSPGVPFAPGDEVSTYELDEPYQPPANVDRQWTAHFEWSDEGMDLEAVARRAALRVLEGLDDKSAEWREDVSLRKVCTCRDQRTLVRVFIEPASLLKWVVSKAERVPAAFRRPGHGADKAWPMMDHPSGAHANPTIVTCKGCGKHWLILSNSRELVAVGVKRLHHGARVQ